MLTSCPSFLPVQDYKTAAPCTFYFAKTSSTNQSYTQQDSKQAAEIAELEEINRQNERLESEKRGLKNKIEDLKQILRLGNHQGEDRISAIKARNEKLEQKAESLRAAL